MKDLKSFEAGWLAAQRLSAHEWGPRPPSSPRDAFKEWFNTCEKGHVIRIKGCLPCKRLDRKLSQWAYGSGPGSLSGNEDI